MSTPSKRRRTSPTTYVSVHDQENQANDQTKPATPKRASYQSPTKASLARSNPRVLQQVAQAKERRESVSSRRRSLRDAVLGNKSPLPQNNDHELDRPATGLSDNVETPRVSESGPENLASNIASIFKDVQPVDAPQTVDDTFPREPPPPSIPTPRRRYVSPAPPPSIIPRLVKDASSSLNQARRSASAELPPTPVQLGKDTAPERPRGLASSSPGGSGRRRIRTRQGNVTSSPLKPRDAPPVLEHHNEELELAEIASGIAEEPGENIVDIPTEEQEDVLEPDEHAPHSIVDSVSSEQHDLNNESDHPVVQEKQKLLATLREQLQALKEDVTKIENFGKRLSNKKQYTIEDNTFDSGMDLLLSSALQPSVWPPLPEENDLFKLNSAKYLTLFAPSNMRLSYETWHKTVKGREKFVYQTTLWAPNCWPLNTSKLTFETTINLEDDATDNIVFVNTRDTPSSLQAWIEARLDNPVMRYDLSTIATGVGQYFDEAVKRAKVLKYAIEGTKRDQEGLLASTPNVLHIDAPVQTNEEAMSLLPYLYTTSHTFAANDSVEDGKQTRTRNRQSIVAEKAVMLTYHISLDWIGQTSKTIDICALGFSDDVVSHARKLFREILSVDGPLKAFQAIWKNLEMSKVGEYEKGAVGTEKTKGRKSKARRMTVFE